MQARFEATASAIVCHLGGCIERAEVGELCDRARPYLEVCPDVVFVCDVRGLAPADLTAVDALARLQLMARRMGREIGVRHARLELLALLDLVGLADCVPESPA